MKELNERVVAGLYLKPNLSRSAKRPALYTAIRSGSVEHVIFLGGFHAKNLSYAASNLGVDAYKLTTGGDPQAGGS
jgi:hypothetical protein